MIFRLNLTIANGLLAKYQSIVEEEENIKYTTNNSNYSNSNASFDYNNVNISHSSLYPLCTFYNETTLKFDINGTGCYVLNSDLTSSIKWVECACIHTTSFVSSWRDFEPQINYVTKDFIKNLTPIKIFTYPLGFIVVSSWLVYCIIVLLLLEFMLPLCIAIK